MLFNILRSGVNAAGERKASAVGGMVAIHAAGRAIWGPRDETSLTRAGYQSNAVVFRAVRMVAEAAAATPMRLTSNGAALTEHPVLSLLAAPNNGQDGAGLLEAVFGNLMLFGDAYLEAAALDDRGAPAELHTLRPDRMRVIPGADGWPEAYEYRVSGRAHRFDMTTEAQPILHMRGFHPLDDHYGMAPLTAAAAAIDIHNSAGKWSKGLLDNAARPSGALVYKGPDGATLSDEQFRRIVNELEDGHQGARNAGRPMLLEGGLDWKPMGFSPSDMEFLKTKEAAAREIALAFGVPPQLLGLPGDTAYSNYQEANRAFYRQTVLPLARRVGAALAGWLGWRWGEILRLTPDLDAIPALQSERESQWRRIAAADFLDAAEKRKLLGLPPRAPAGE
ncbi:phage portal protein [Pikeienuella piscinae]|uniref:Phage portal protein n=1 Tax=Pikeienuella piscinae TaxID=2748098 RepID=A0A7L5BX96_9RHOB|nr:phage portal protein [Pikeienuella piscinae]QIE54514.1 phage portal protein [Pikeienuella piscinae]